MGDFLKQEEEINISKDVKRKLRIGRDYGSLEGIKPSEPTGSRMVRDWRISKSSGWKRKIRFINFKSK